MAVDPRPRIGKSGVIYRTGLPDETVVAEHKGQLYVDILDGKFYQASAAGKGVDWTHFNPGSVTIEVSEDPDNPGFAVISTS